MAQRWFNPHTWRRIDILSQTDFFTTQLSAMKIVKIVPNTHQFIKSKNFVKKLAIALGYVPNIPTGLFLVSIRS